MYKKTLCLGGSFNPIHHGHLLCARAVAETAGYQRVLLIPSGQPPHKPPSADLAAPLHRLAMARLAISLTKLDAAEVQFDVTDLEIVQNGPSYTIETVRALKQQGWDQVHWLIGADMLNYLPKWHLAADLVQEAHFLVMARPGIELAWDRLPPALQALRKNVVPAPLIDISATDIRQRVRMGKSIRYLTPEPVVEHIQQHRLYQSESPSDGTVGL
jgi:nicotinate-nucleotide adenylyltransferase